MRSQLSELTDLLRRHAGEGVSSTPIPRLTFHRRTRPTVDDHRFFPPALSVVVQGSIWSSVGRESAYEYDASSYVVTSLDLPTASRVAAATPRRPYFSLMLAFSAEHLAAMVAEAGAPVPPTRSASAAGAHWRAPMTEELLDAVLRLVRLLDEPGAIPFLAPPREREVLYRLLTGAQGARLRTLAQRGGDNTPIAAAVARLKADLGRPLYVAELADTANMSVTSFHRRFRELTTLSPVQYHKRLRLHEARRLLLLTTITAAQAAEHVGYRSASQFTRDYRRVYGQPPRRDVASAAAHPALGTDARR